MKKKKITHVLGSTVLSSALVLSMGTASVFANEDETNTQEVTEAEGQETQPVEETTAEEQQSQQLQKKKMKL
ncbi:hypothetical protein [Mesobacillus jeotgali]|uniref:Uncharacterized protein n=1 Tax=Mesobacillus jeotgali TaxID=129985 RepID=A0ABY9VKA8_9BACI|nr:hypothetical protein [Mesobacillus jeotgali]WNF23579.1 hypothetical protein RH061_03450 [Mesobacillus jeotgali]